MSPKHIAVVSLCLFGCQAAADKRKAQQQAENKRLEERARSIAGEMAQRATDEAERRQQTALEQARAERELMRREVSEHPAKFLEVGKVQATDHGWRRLTSLSLTNNSRFAVSNIGGTVDFHGPSDIEPDILAQVPVQLSGSLAPGATMTFTQDLHNIAGAAGVRFEEPISHVTFTVRSVEAVTDVDLEQQPEQAPGDGGAENAQN